MEMRDHKGQNLEEELKNLMEGELYTDHKWVADPSKLCHVISNDCKDMEWIRARKIPCLTDDEGDIHMFKHEYLDQKGVLHQTDMKREYHSLKMPNSALDAAFEVYSKFVEGSFQSKPYINFDHLEQGIVVVMLRIDQHMEFVVLDDYLPCIDNQPIYAKARSGALWCSFVEKALAKVFGTYEYIATDDWKVDNEFYCVGQFLNNLLPFPTQEYDLCKKDITNLVLNDKLQRVLGTFREKNSKVYHNTNCLVENEYLLAAGI